MEKKRAAEQGFASRPAWLKAALGAVALTVLVGAGYAAIPAYNALLGAGDADAAPVSQYGTRISDHTIKVNIEAKLARGMMWGFQPKKPVVETRLGAAQQVDYEVSNPTARALGGIASFEITPKAAAPYFNLLECFCSSNLALRPGEVEDMPVVFMIDPYIAKDPKLEGVTEITLSYTFYPIDEDEVAAALANPAASRSHSTIGG